MTPSFRNAGRDELATALQEARAHTLMLFDRLAAAGMDNPARVPRLEIINPPLWELGHLAWFAEWYILREAASSAPDAAQGRSLLAQGDAWFDSNQVAHDTRWSLGLPPAGAIKTYCSEVLDRALGKLGAAAEDDASLYPWRLALAHEDMHGEAFAYTLQTIGGAAPAAGSQASQPSALPARQEIRFAGGTIALGSPADAGFAFDNEQRAHDCHVPSFTIDAALVSNAQYAEFIADGGYDRPQFWTAANRPALRPPHPSRGRRAGAPCQSV
jgi:iron(II)-dependent oxidoreductase